jgi:hypothetical protein
LPHPDQRGSKVIGGYALGVVTNGMLAAAGTTPAFLVAAIALSVQVRTPRRWR